MDQNQLDDAMARDMVKAVLKELSKRKGFDYWWEDLEAMRRAEIKRALKKRLIECMRDEDDN